MNPGIIEEEIIPNDFKRRFPSRSDDAIDGLDDIPE